MATIVCAAPAVADDLTLAQGSIYHGDVAHSGAYVMPGLTWNSAATLHQSTTFIGTTTGNILAQPLYYLPPGAKNGVLIVATDQGFVSAMDSITGATVWSMSVGPVTTGTVCGHAPLKGVAGTPVIDDLKGIVYLDGAIADATGQVHQEIFALDAATGAVLPGWPLDVAAGIAKKGMSFNAGLEGQRPAMTKIHNRIYVAFGGSLGDCSTYQGVVAAVDVSRPKLVDAWITAGIHGGVWSQGGVVSDGTSLFFATGNGHQATTWQDGDGVFRLPSNLSHSTDPHDYYVPANFAYLDSKDLDLGGTAPVVLNVPNGTGTSPWLLQMGKDGNAYVLDRTNLGGMGGQLLVQQVSSTEIRTGPAVYATTTADYVAFQGSGVNCPGNPPLVALTMLAVTATPAPAISVAWCAAGVSNGSPTITTIDGTSQPIVWQVGVSGDQLLHGYKALTGETVFAGGTNSDRVHLTQHFITIQPAENRLYLAGANRLYAYDFTPGL